MGAGGLRAANAKMSWSHRSAKSHPNKPRGAAARSNGRAAVTPRPFLNALCLPMETGAGRDNPYL